MKLITFGATIAQYIQCGEKKLVALTTWIPFPFYQFTFFKIKAHILTAVLFSLSVDNITPPPHTNFIQNVSH